LVERVLKQLVAFSFNFSFFFPLLKEAKSMADIPIRALYLLNDTEVCSIHGRYIRVKKLTLWRRSA